MRRFGHRIAAFLNPTSDGGFSGATQGLGCASELNGTRYATSSVEVARDAAVTWDRGYDVKGNHFWEAEHGPYRFERFSGDEETKVAAAAYRIL